MTSTTPAHTDVPLIDADHFEVAQRFRPLVNQYDVAATDGSRPGPVAFVHQKRLKLKERIEFFTDKSKSDLLCTVQARKVFEMRSGYDVQDKHGTTIGVLQKVAGKSMLRSTWTIASADGGQVATVSESSMAIALLRRALNMLGAIPFVGPFLAWFPIPYGFTFTAPDGTTVLGTHKRVITLRDKYTLDMSADTQRTVDRRLAVAMAVCLDALQAR